MGGTSTDVSRYAGDFEHVFEASIAGVTVQVGGGRVSLQMGLQARSGSLRALGYDLYAVIAPNTIMAPPKLQRRVTAKPAFA